MNYSSGNQDLEDKLRKLPGAVVETGRRLAEFTTFRVGGTPRAIVRCATEQSVVEAVQLIDAASAPLLLLSGGSNLLIGEGEVDYYVVVLENSWIEADPDTGLLRAGAGTPWDEVVARSVQLGLGGIECLSGIPGGAGATPVQNVGAYGVEVADVLTRVHLLERATGEVAWVPAEDLELSYRYSNLKFSGRGVVLAVEFQLLVGGLSAPLRYGELSRRLGEGRQPVAAVRQAVLELRRAKGMVLDEQDHDTWSAGSFFTNPIVDTALAEAIAQDFPAMPAFPAGEGRTKLSAAWLIDNAGFKKGYPHAQAPARLSTKHTLALSNRGQARAEDIVALAREVRAGVQARFRITLEPEPVWIGVEI